MQIGRQIINEKLNKIKSHFDKSILIVLIFILSNISSYILGYLSYKNENLDISFQRVELETHLPKYNPYFIVASKYGKNYYYIWCKSANRIKDSNRIYFKSEKEAEGKGYQKAKSCK